MCPAQSFGEDSFIWKGKQACLLGLRANFPKITLRVHSGVAGLPADHTDLPPQRGKRFNANGLGPPQQKQTKRKSGVERSKSRAEPAKRKDCATLENCKLPDQPREQAKLTRRTRHRASAASSGPHSCETISLATVANKPADKRPTRATFKSRSFPSQ